MEVFSILFGLIWMVVVISIIVKVASGASKAARTQQQISQRVQQMQQFRMPSQQSQGVRSQSGKVYDAQQESMDRARQQSFRNVPGATYGSSNTGSRGAFSGYKSNPVDVKTQSVLFEDRKNDWLAKQFREEAALKRRAGVDLGASHEVECAADDLRRSHVRRHNTTGLNKSTFR